MKVGGTNPPIDFTFDQSPCDWDQTYELVVTSQDGSNKVIPAFMSIDGTILLIDKPTAQDSGSYNIIICSQISNSVRTESCTDFSLTVETVSGTNTTVILKPEWHADLEN